MKKLQMGLFLILILSMIASGCSRTDSLIDIGIHEYSDGKPTVQYSDPNTLEELNKLLTAYTSGIQTVAITKVNPEDIDVPDDTIIPLPSETSTVTDPSDTITPIPSDTSKDSEAVTTMDEVRTIIRSAMKNTQSNVTFTTQGLDLTIDSLADIVYTDKTYEDIIGSICISGLSYYQQDMLVGDRSVVSVQLTYTMPTDEVVQMKEKTEQKVQAIAASLELENLSYYDRIVAVHDYLCDTVTYPEGSDYPAVKHTAYGALIDGSAVCDGYARAGQLLYTLCGVECLYISGICTNGIGHAWNLVKIDGGWYQLDITWDDGSLSNDYFLVDDAFMSQSRTWDTALYPSSEEDRYSAA